MYIRNVRSRFINLMLNKCLSFELNIVEKTEILTYTLGAKYETESPKIKARLCRTRKSTKFKGNFKLN